MEILKGCDFVIAGIKYGISAGMSREIALADAAGIDVVNADKLALYLRYRKIEEYVIKRIEKDHMQTCADIMKAFVTEIQRK